MFLLRHQKSNTVNLTSKFIHNPSKSIMSQPRKPKFKRKSLQSSPSHIFLISHSKSLSPYSQPDDFPNKIIATYTNKYTSYWSKPKPHVFSDSISKFSETTGRSKKYHSKSDRIPSKTLTKSQFPVTDYSKCIEIHETQIGGKRKSINVQTNYVPGTTASIQGEVGAAGGWVVVSWVPVRRMSVDLAASHPESSFVFPTSAIVLPIPDRALDPWPVWTRPISMPVGALSNNHVEGSIPVSWSAVSAKDTGFIVIIIINVFERLCR